MTSRNAKEYLPFVLALAEGKTIQTKINDQWHDVSTTYFEAYPENYRIKPDPRRYWIVKKSEHEHFVAFTESGAVAMRANIHRDFQPEIIEVVEVVS